MTGERGLAIATAGRESTPAVAAVAIGTSAGGLHALEIVLASLPADLPAPVLVVQHLAPAHRSHLADILARHTEMVVKAAEDGDLLRPGVVYLGVPDVHLEVEPDATITLTHSATVHFARPSIDRLFESMAACYGPRGLGVILTGTGTDGAAGVRAIAIAGGTVFVEDPATAEFGAMPQAAVATGCVDRVLPVEEIGSAVQHRVLGSQPRA